MNDTVHGFVATLESKKWLRIGSEGFRDQTTDPDVDAVFCFILSHLRLEPTMGVEATIWRSRIGTSRPGIARNRTPFGLIPASKTQQKWPEKWPICSALHGRFVNLRYDQKAPPSAVVPKIPQVVVDSALPAIFTFSSREQAVQYCDSGCFRRSPPKNKTNNIRLRPAISMTVYSLQILSDKAFPGSYWTQA